MTSMSCCCRSCWKIESAMGKDNFRALRRLMRDPVPCSLRKRRARSVNIEGGIPNCSTVWGTFGRIRWMPESSPGAVRTQVFSCASVIFRQPSPRLAHARFGYDLQAGFQSGLVSRSRAGKAGTGASGLRGVFTRMLCRDQCLRALTHHPALQSTAFIINAYPWRTDC